VRRGLFAAKLDKKIVKELLASKERQETPEKTKGLGLGLPRLRLGKPRVPRLEVRLPSLRSIPRVRVSRGRLEGAESLAMPTGLGKIVRTSSGSVMLLEDTAAVFPYVDNASFGPLQPLVELSDLQELFISSEGIVATIGGRRYWVALPRELLVDRLADHIAIISGINISERNPQAAGEYHGFRVNITRWRLSGGTQITLTRLSPPESVSFDPLLTARLVTLLASPVSMLIYGPPGSGKTTLLIHLVNTLASLFPSANISIVEEEPEVAPHVRGNVRKYFSFQRTVTENIRITRRFDRPDLLVVGELRGEEVISWFEAAGSGIPVLTTVHAKSLADARKRLDTIIQSAGISASITDVIPLYVETCKTLTDRGIERGVGAAYLLTEGGLQPVYKGVHIPEEDFAELLPPTLQFSLARDARETYEAIKRALGVNTSSYSFVKLGKVAMHELPE
jgi:pilus assembly protein CpaF